MKEILIYIGAAYTKSDLYHGYRVAISTLIVVDKTTVPSITTEISSEKFPTRARLKSLIHTLQSDKDLYIGKTVNVFMMDDFVQFTFNNAIHLDELEKQSNKQKTTLKDLDLWAQLVSTIRSAGCLLYFGANALLLRQCNMAAKKYLDSGRGD